MSETAHWKAAVSGNFADANNWSTGGVPGTSNGQDNGDTALLDAAGADYAVTFNTSGVVYNLGHLSVAANATLYVIGSKGTETTLDANIVENDGKIVVGAANGGSGADLSAYDFGNPNAQVNKGLIVVKASGELGGPIDNEGTIDVIGGYVADYATAGTGKFRINGGHLEWGSTNLGTVNFYGTGGGEFELDQNADAKMATISGFSDTGNTSVVVDYGTEGNIRVEQTASATEVVLSNHHWLRFTGDFIGDTFSVVQQGDGVLITCQQGSDASSAASRSAALANFTQALAQTTT